MTTLAIQTLLEPIQNKLYFAGEAICDEHGVGATVEAAFASGLRVAKEIIDRKE
jgi:predicted NAD/FAD-dependent oxidoreductase